MLGPISGDRAVGRWVARFAIVGAFITFGCDLSQQNSGVDGASSGQASSSEVVTLWEERPAPPPGGTIGVYVQLSDDAPKGVLSMSSREARICGQGASPSPDGSVTDAGATPRECPFNLALATTGGSQRFAVVLVPTSPNVPPLLLAVLLDDNEKTVTSVFRRFYPAAPSGDAEAGAPVNDGGRATSDGDGGAPADSAIAGDTREAGSDAHDGAAVETGGGDAP